MTFIGKLLTVVAHCACAGAVMTANRTVNLKLAIWLCSDCRSHPRIYIRINTWS